MILIPINGQKRTAAHARITISLFIFFHDFLRNIIRHHALRGAFCRQPRQFPVTASFPDVIFFQNINKLWKSRRNIDSFLILDPLHPLKQHLSAVW